MRAFLKLFPLAVIGAMLTTLAPAGAIGENMSAGAVGETTAAGAAVESMRAGAAAGQKPPPPRCNGFNLLDKLAATDPGLHERVVSNSANLENGKAVLWRIERPGRPVSHLFGTVHLSDERVTTLSDATTEALVRANTVIIENADLSADATAKAYNAATKTALFGDGRKLDDLLSKDEFDKVRRAIKSTRAALRPFRPWVVSLMLTGSECERRRLSDGQLVLDMQIADRARQLGIPINGVETTAQQLAALAAIPDDEQVGILRSNIALMDENENLIETMVQLYLTRRVGALWDLQIALAEKAGVPATSFASFEQKIIVDRNRRMRDRSLYYLEKGGAFIAVGALHLPGKTGLVALLREAGYTLTAIE